MSTIGLSHFHISFRRLTFLPGAPPGVVVVVAELAQQVRPWQSPLRQTMQTIYTQRSSVGSLLPKSKPRGAQEQRRGSSGACRGSLAGAA